MLYKKLQEIYDQSDCNKFFHRSLLINLNDLIVWSLKRNRRNLSPFKFANLSNIETREAIKFFMYFSSIPHGVFELEFFFECTNHRCDKRIYLENSDLTKNSNVITCEECKKSYLVGEIRDFIKVYFRLKDDMVILASKSNVVEKQRTDPNSTFDALTGMSDNLKPHSPSSLSNTNIRFDEGDADSSVDLNIIVDIDKHATNPIFNEGLLASVMEYMHD
ncbi:hypothetical protein BK143_09315 [Paenibacillus peoriae]|uniref:hypothetical protein n=1 Tax=Paenibacillus TaxID=44249 RepID=UPI00096CC17B|nr:MULTISPECIES: hypothetical protein [Paenibacillus]OMF72459.1 hypothetical protein BK143_09315 [Paenibacillus peoriae]